MDYRGGLEIIERQTWAACSSLAVGS